ncbi:hypothetical protein PYW08_011276 [Mythimna loreyi]|uniref:Uncharacterized protein n=1 Tax=Mythimna loreyi TaxID=667449 RepID=A0ACC2Q3Q3_9NEOP|nr:hypothetical protein PYW08_011276 [Mythimna loreyi]
MPRTQRSPPATPVVSKQRATSSPDISTNVTEVGPSNVTARHKRFCPDFSPEQQPLAQSNSRFESFENKIVNMLTTWKQEQDAVLNRITSDINEVKKQNREIHKTNTEIEKAIEFMNQAYETMKTTVEKLEQERVEQRTYIIELEKKVLDLQQNSRTSSFEIRNIPQGEKETNDDLTSIVLRTCNKLEVSVKQADLRDIYRMPGKKGSNRPIVAELVTVPQKNRVLQAARMFNKGRASIEKLNTNHIGISGDAKPIYVSDHLSNSLRQLFFEARKYASDNEYKFCWSQNNKIFLRKSEGMPSIIIKSLACLNNLSKSK